MRPNPFCVTTGQLSAGCPYYFSSLHTVFSEVRRSLMKGFKQFLLRGNVIDLAVGVVIGAAFAGVVAALVKDILSPLIAAVAKLPDFSNWSFVVNGSKFLYGDFLSALLTFL